MIVLGFDDEPVCYLLDLRNDFDANSPGAAWHNYVVLPEPDTHRGNRECASDMHRAKQWPHDAMLEPDMPAIFCVEEYGEWIIIRPYTTVVLPHDCSIPWHEPILTKHWIMCGMSQYGEWKVD